MFHLYSSAVGFLSSNRMLDIYLQGREPSSNELNLELFLAQREFTVNLPNQIHDNNRMEKIDEENLSFLKIFYNSMEKLSQLLYCSDKVLYVNSNNLDTWQSVLVYVNPVLIVAWKLASSDKCVSVKVKNKNSLLPVPETNYLKDKSFHELHIHINGTSESIYTWLDFLQDSSVIRKIINKSYNKVTMQYKQLGIERMGKLYEIIEKARYVREFLMDFSRNEIAESELTNIFMDSWKKYFNDHSSPVPYKSKIRFNEDEDEENKYKLASETEMWENLFFLMKDKSQNNGYTNEKKEKLLKLIHFYILAMSLFGKFLVQQQNQYGFSQFQLITDNELRDIYEDKGYRDRFLQLMGENNDLNHLELRFAPKNTIEKMSKLYQKVLLDYQYVKNNKSVDYKLKTVAHFIKFNDDKRIDGLPLECRWANTRKKLENQARVLLMTIGSSKIEEHFTKDNEKYYECNLFSDKMIKPSHVDFFENFVGLDAAGNELYARPEVFVPIFDWLHKEFLDRFDKRLNLTFHAGEDYVHLLSGIRYVWEAIHFLGMDKEEKWAQCRIGHATAIGITPKCWADKLNSIITMSKGEWLDSMIFAQHFDPSSHYYYTIERLWKYIYGLNKPNFQRIWESYVARKEDPYESSDALIKLYNSPDVVSRYNEMMQIKIDSYDINIMLKLQRIILKQMKDHNIAIESMITSNVRISYYDKHEQHHIYRWLFPEGVEEDIIPPIVLASDDPGLFNNNMRIEFSHLYEILKKKGKNDFEIQDKIDELQRNAKSYAFRNVII